MSIEEVRARAYSVPTDQPEADGTIAWNSTTLVTVSLRDGDTWGLGFTYASDAAVTIIEDVLRPLVVGREASETPRIADAMARAVRNLGRPGVAACAISAVDVALWDLRARQLGVALVDLLGRRRDRVPIYGSGGFTTYDDATTTAQLSRWVHEWGIPRVKIKIGESGGREEGRDLARVALARRVIGEAELYVDANGGYQVKQAIRLGQRMVEDANVRWFEEPVSSDDLAGLSRVRARFEGDVAAGEYGYSPDYFARMIDAGAVDCLQADLTRCGGYSAWLKVAGLAEAHQLQISAHCAPNLHAHVGAAVGNLRHLEYFHDHHRIETTLFEGALSPEGGTLEPDRASPGHGLRLLDEAAAPFRVL